MYNETVKFINKNKYFEGPKKGEYITSLEKLRNEYLKDKKREIIEKLKMEILAKDIDFDDHREGSEKKIIKENKTVTVPVHILDDAIHAACSMFKSAITNKRNGHIKSFRIRCIKQSKKDKHLHVQADDFGTNGFFPTVIGHLELKDLKEKDQKNMAKNKKEDTILIVDSNETKQDLPKKNESAIENDDNIIATDPPEKKKRKVRKKNPDREKVFFKGIEITGDSILRYNYGKDRFELLISEMILEIGTNLSKMIEDDLKKLDEIMNNPKIPKKIKKKYERRINGRIGRRVEDLHWKTRNYLTKKLSDKELRSHNIRETKYQINCESGCLKSDDEKSGKCNVIFSVYPKVKQVSEKEDKFTNNK